MDWGPWLRFRFRRNPIGSQRDCSVTCLVFDARPSSFGLLLAGGTVLVFLGLADDRRGIPWQLRLVVEVSVAVFVVYTQGLQLTAFIDLPWITGLLSVLWIVG